MPDPISFLLYTHMHINIPHILRPVASGSESGSGRNCPKNCSKLINFQRARSDLNFHRIELEIWRAGTLIIPL